MKNTMLKKKMPLVAATWTDALRRVRNRIALVAAAICVAAASPSLAGLVARWDFNNYDPSNPTSAAILAPTVGNLAAIPCTGTTASTEVTDGTLGSITVVNIRELQILLTRL